MANGQLITTRSENEIQPRTEKAYREVRRAPSFSGPLMLPNRASANSLSAPIKSSGGNASKIFIVIVTSASYCYRLKDFVALFVFLL